jgi:hypothetical protein
LEQYFELKSQPTNQQPVTSNKQPETSNCLCSNPPNPLWNSSLPLFQSSGQRGTTSEPAIVL